MSEPLLRIENLAKHTELNAGPAAIGRPVETERPA